MSAARRKKGIFGRDRAKTGRSRLCHVPHHWQKSSAMSLRMSAGSIGDNSRTSGLIVVAISLRGRRSLASISLVDHDPVTSLSDVTN
jgi:hypothetical protein